MLKKRKGQLTLFIIIAIVIFIITLIYFYLQVNYPPEKTYDPKVEVLKENLQDCFKETYSTSLNIIGYQGGYLNVPDPKVEVPLYYFSFNIPYYYYEGNLYTPTIEKIEAQTEEIILPGVKSCLEQYKTSITNKSNINDLSYDNFNIDVKIKEEEVIFTNNLKLTVHYDNKSVIVDFEKTPITIPSDIYDMHEIASFIANYLEKNNEWIPFDNIVELSREHNLYIDLANSEDGYYNSVTIKTPREGYYPEVFQFNNKYSFDDLEEVLPLV